MDDPRPAEGLGASLFEASEDSIKTIDLDGTLLSVNGAGAALMEFDDAEAICGQPWISLWPEACRPTVEAAVNEARGGRGSRFFAERPTAKGAPKWWEVTVAPVFEDGRTVRLVSIARDVTERVRVQEENALLVHELAHRIKNMFAVVDGVISLSARGAPDAKVFADSLRERLLGLGRAIAHVAPPELIGLDLPNQQTLHGLLHVLLEPYGDIEGEDRRVLITGDDVVVGRSATTSVALFANELATNALKYGALSTPKGRVQVTTRLTGEGLELTWAEHGVEDVAPQSMTPGFGTTLMDNAVARQLAGRLTRVWGPRGLVVRISLPPERLAR